MPKYVLDEKEILTITSEHDGGIFTFNDILKKMTIVLLVVSIVSSIGLYGFFTMMHIQLMLQHSTVIPAFLIIIRLINLQGLPSIVILGTDLKNYTIR